MLSTDDMEIRLRVYGEDRHKLHEILKIKQDQETGEIMLGTHNNYQPDFFLTLGRISVTDYGVFSFTYFDIELQEYKTVELA